MDTNMEKECSWASLIAVFCACPDVCPLACPDDFPRIWRGVCRPIQIWSCGTLCRWFGACPRCRGSAWGDLTPRADPACRLPVPTIRPNSLPGVLGAVFPSAPRAGPLRLWSVCLRRICVRRTVRRGRVRTADGLRRSRHCADMQRPTLCGWPSADPVVPADRLCLGVAGPGRPHPPCPRGHPALGRCVVGR
jgi:hypothetical protein